MIHLAAELNFIEQMLLLLVFDQCVLALNFDSHDLGFSLRQFLFPSFYLVGIFGQIGSHALFFWVFNKCFVLTFSNFSKCAFTQQFIVVEGFWREGTDVCDFFLILGLVLSYGVKLFLYGTGVFGG